MTCIREDELLEALGRAYVGPELEAHVQGCAACSELQLVAGALLDDSAVAFAEAALPSSGTMWWRMRIRQRQEAQLTARRSLLIGQAVTLVIALTLIAAFFGSDVTSQVKWMIATISLSTPLLLAVATWLLVAPIAGWVALKQK